MWSYDDPKLWPSAVYGVIALLGFVISRAAGDHDLLYVTGGGLMVLGGIPAALTVLVYAGRWGVEILDTGMKAATRTKQSAAAEAVRHLTAEQLQVVRLTGELSVGVMVTAKGPRVMVHGTGVPLDFLKYEFLPRCGMDKEGVTHTAPISSWSDGKTWKDYGQCRSLAREFTQYLVMLGLASWGSGNQSATLTGDMTAFELRKMLGLVDRGETMEEWERRVEHATSRTEMEELTG